jgi:hypothetical protein
VVEVEAWDITEDSVWSPGIIILYFYNPNLKRKKKVSVEISDGNIDGDTDYSDKLRY